MSKKMLIDASHPEETRVVVVEGTRVEELDFESRNKRQLRGNVYLARVTRVEPSLQAAFVEYGGNRHGFLAFSEIHPDYYQIPYEDRLALIEAEKAEIIEDDAEDEKDDQETDEKNEAEENADALSDSGKDDDGDEENDADGVSEDEDADETSEDDDDEDDDDEVAAEQAKTASTRRRRISRRRYKIQEVIKRGQILLIQVVKEERGNKGAAMTTYLSLAGRYCVLMPNTPRGGGISRKISNGSDRKRLKTIMSDLEVPQGMGVIVRTAGAKRTKVEIKRDYDYLSRLWATVRETTLKSIAPALIHEEGDLVKRSIRDLYNKDIDEILVQGKEAFKSAKTFIKMLMPSHAKNVKLYDDPIPLYLRYSVEKQIEGSLSSLVQLKSGGYLVIHPTEALVSVDVNSGRSTRERNVERTALKTNLEAAEEVARQMRMRDLAGLVVIDFIDMDENRNNRAVEKRMKEALSKDRARVQMSRISQFGLMEISRQRRRRSLLEGSTANCEHCDGVGRKRTVESSALAAIRAIEEIGARRQMKRIRLKVSSDVAVYIFNEKRDLLHSVDAQFDMFTELVGDDTLIRPAFAIESLENRPEEEDPLAAIEVAHRKASKKNEKSRKKRRNDESDNTEEQNAQHSHSELDENGEPKKRRRRRGRRGGRGKKGHAETVDAQQMRSEDRQDDDKTSQSDVPDSTEGETSKPAKKARSSSRRKAPARKGKSQTDSSDEALENPQAEELVEAKSTPRSSARRKAPNRKEKAEKPSKKKAASKKKTDDQAPDNSNTEKDEAKSVKAKSAARRKAPARKEKPESDTTTVSKAGKPKTKTQKAKESKTKLKAKSTARRRAAPKKEGKEPETDAAPKPKKAAKKTPTKKAPAKKAPAKKAATKKAPAKRATPKKAPAKKTTTKSASSEKAEPVKRKETAKSPGRKKAPSRPVKAEVTSKILTEDSNKSEAVGSDTKKPKKRGWFGLRKKPD